MERRNFIRALIALAIGVPIAVEGATFSRLFYERLTGEGGSGTRSAGEGVGTGEELLPQTDARDTITDMSLEASGDSESTFRLTVEVENTTGKPYRLKIGPVSLTDGSTVGETVSTGDLDPDATTTLTGEWQIPQDADVEAVWAGGRTGSETVTERVLLAPTDATD